MRAFVNNLYEIITPTPISNNLVNNFNMNLIMIPRSPLFILIMNS